MVGANDWMAIAKRVPGLERSSSVLQVQQGTTTLTSGFDFQRGVSY